MQKYSRATGSGVLRAAVAGYLIYLGYNIISDMLSGVSGMQPALAWLIGILFIACAIAFAVYSYIRYRKELKAAEFPTQAGESSPDSESEH